MQTRPERFATQTRGLLDDQENELLLSAASSWEIAIKYSFGRLSLPVPPSKYVPDRLMTSGVRPLAIDHGDALHVATLPPHHRDPFDRLIISQAQLRKISIVTADPQFENYDVSIVNAL